MKILKVVIGHLMLISFVAFAFFCVNAFMTFDPSQIDFGYSTTKVYDSNKELLYEISENNAAKNSPVGIEDVPVDCQNGVIATEDKTFRSNIGIDRNGVLRFGLTLVSFGRYKAGGSTITQQVVKNANENIYGRNPFLKIKEGIQAVKLNSYFTKDEILEMYLNNVYFGNLNYGIQSASLDYFGKDVSELDLSECSYLVGLPQSPSVYNPYVDLELGLERQKIVLDAMLAEGYITDDQMKIASDQELVFTPNEFEIRAAHFVQFLQDLFGIKSEQISDINSIDSTLKQIDWKQSYQIYTFYNYELHQNVLQQLRKTMAEDSAKKIQNAGAVAIDKDGKLITMIGSIDFFSETIDGKFNSALGYREPGELYVPLFYDYVLRNQLVGEDAQIKSSIFEAIDVSRVKKTGEVVEDFRYMSKDYHEFPDATVTIGDAISTLELIPALNLALELNFDPRVIQSGVTSGNDFFCNEIFLLEGCESTLLDLVWNYHVLRNGESGLHIIDYVLNSRDGSLVYINDYDQDELNPRSRVFDFSDEKVINIKATNLNEKDLWFITSTPEYTLGIWYELTEK